MAQSGLSGRMHPRSDAAFRQRLPPPPSHPLPLPPVCLSAGAAPLAVQASAFSRRNKIMRAREADRRQWVCEAWMRPA
jgi:hypothetical protein